MQARLLRQLRLADADLANIIEEIETLGRKEVSELRSRYRILCQHLLKAMYQPEKASLGWATTILNQRIEIADHMRENPSLKAKADELFLQAYLDVRKLAAAETGLPKLFPALPPFTRDQALDQSWQPLSAAPRTSD